MAKQRTPVRRPQVVNPKNVKTPSEAQKMISVANRVGIPGIADQQGSSFNIFDTLVLATNTNPTVLDFFSNVGGKSANFTNFQVGGLKAGEAMVMQEVAFFLVNLTAATLSLDTTSILDVKPISEIAGTGIVSNAGAFKLSTMQIDVANQTVVKSFLIFETMPEFNPRTGGIATPVESTAGAPFTTFGSSGQNKIPLESPAVLPPNQNLSVKLRVPPIGTLTGTWGIMCVIGRFGSIFASKTTL